MKDKPIFFSILGSWMTLVVGTGCAGAPVASPAPTPLAQIVAPRSVPPSATVVVASSPHIEITPSKALVDEKVSIRLIGAQPSQLVTLRARAEDDRHIAWESHATFRADNAGMVDLGLQKPN